MALVNMGICDPGPGVSVSLDYDAATLLVTDLNYANTSGRDAHVTFTISGTAHPFTLAAGTARTTRDVSALGLVCVHTTPPKGDPSIGLPANVTVNCSWG